MNTNFFTKIALVILFTFSFSFLTFGQTPAMFKYQAVLRDASGNILANQSKTVVIDILQSDLSTTVFTESHNVTTTAQGLINLNIGSIEDLSGIDWTADTYFIQITVDGTVMGTSQLLSVPYALTAKTAEAVNYSNVTNTPLIPSDLSDLTDNTSLLFDGNWGSLVGTAPNVSTFTNDANYLTNFTESDPTYTTNFDLTGTASGDLLKFDGSKFVKFTPNYLTSFTEVDGSITNEIQNLSQVLTQNPSAGNVNITNLANPVNDQDAVTKAYVDMMMTVMENNGISFVDFSSDIQTLIINNSVNFTDNSTINPTSWAWDFGDGTTSTQQNPSHIYTVEGIYTVSLTASNGVLTKTETKTDFISVNIDGPGAGVTDIDGNNYASVIIGNQEWMAEDLKVSHYSDGTAIPYIDDDATWAALADDNTSDAYSVYGDSNNDGTVDVIYPDYGYLYSWSAAMGDNAVSSTTNPSGVQGVCPDGWHLPSEAEWTELTDYLGGESIAGGKLKETGTTHWFSPNTGATNETGFTAFPGGYRTNDTGSSSYLGSYGRLWSATEIDATYAWYRGLYYNNSDVGRGFDNKSFGFSVRCLRD